VNLGEACHDRLHVYLVILQVYVNLVVEEGFADVADKGKMTGFTEESRHCGGRLTFLIIFHTLADN
jgi:hypothetical protein